MMKSRIRNTADALVYYTDVAIATYQDTLIYKKYGKADRQRAREIAHGMVQALRAYEPNHPELRLVVERLDEATAEDEDSTY